MLASPHLVHGVYFYIIHTYNKGVPLSVLKGNNVHVQYSKYQKNNLTLLLHVAIVVKISQLPILTVDPNVHTGAFLTVFYCNFDHPEQYQIMLLPVKNRRVILTSKCTYSTTRKVWQCWTFKCTTYTCTLAGTQCINILTDFDPCSHRRVLR